MTDLKGAVIGMLVGALFMTAAGYLAYSHHAAVANAEPVDATVLESGVYGVEEDADDGGGTTYYATVRYRYTYEGETYTSTNICPGDGSGCWGPNTESNARALVEQYPEGEETTAYVSPEDPTQSFLERGSVPLIYLGVAGMGLLALVLSALNLVSIVTGVDIPGIPADQ